MVLSDDEEYAEEEEDEEEGEESAQTKTRRKRGSSNRAAARAADSARVPSFTRPLPLAYQKVEGGFQKYKLPDNLRVYQRRKFDYSAQYKDGDVLPVRPVEADPPQLFPDFFKYDPRARLATALPYEGPLLQWRVEARIVRQGFGMFVGQELDNVNGPPDEGAYRSLPPPPHSHHTATTQTEAARGRPPTARRLPRRSLHQPPCPTATLIAADRRADRAVWTADCRVPCHRPPCWAGSALAARPCRRLPRRSPRPISPSHITEHIVLDAGRLTQRAMQPCAADKLWPMKMNRLSRSLLAVRSRLGSMRPGTHQKWVGRSAAPSHLQLMRVGLRWVGRSDVSDSKYGRVQT